MACGGGGRLADGEREALLRELARFDAELPVERAWTPPASWYLEPAVLAAERAAVFRGWQVVGRADQVARPGTWIAGETAGEPWIAARGEDGELRAFSAVCRHHAALVAEGPGAGERLRCPYHGWTYDLAGRLTSAPRFGGALDFARGDLALPPFAAAEAGPLVLLRTGGEDGGELERWRAAARALERSGWDELAFVERRVYRLDCNWKVYVDNYLDGGYHVPVLHGGLAGELDLASYATELLPGGVLQTCRPASGAGAGTARTGDAALYLWLWPNVMVNRYGAWMDVDVVRPLSVDRTEVVIDWYAAPEVARDAGTVARALEASERVQAEDERICAAVQRGLASGSYDRGRYAPRVEHGMHAFHRALAAALARA